MEISVRFAEMCPLDRKPPNSQDTGIAITATIFTGHGYCHYSDHIHRTRVLPLQRPYSQDTSTAITATIFTGHEYCHYSDHIKKNQSYYGAGWSVPNTQARKAIILRLGFSPRLKKDSNRSYLGLYFKDFEKYQFVEWILKREGSKKLKLLQNS